MPALDVLIVKSLRTHLPPYPLADLTAAVEALLMAAPTRLKGQQMQVPVSDYATLTNCTVSVGNVTDALNLPDPPDLLTGALAHYASTVPAIWSTALQAVLDGADLTYGGAHVPASYADSWAQFCTSVKEYQHMLQAVDQFIHATIRSGYAVEYRDEWRQEVARPQQELTIEPESAHFFSEVLRLLDAGGDATGLGGGLTNGYDLVWAVIINGIVQRPYVNRG